MQPANISNNYSIPKQLKLPLDLEKIIDISDPVYTFCEVMDRRTFVSGKGHRKSLHQKQYQEMQGYLERLKNYARHVEICGETRNSYSKTDHDATFMRVKRDYMGNDQLLPAYNMQAAICDEYIAVVDAKSYASDTEYFVPLMEKFSLTCTVLVLEMEVHPVWAYSGASISKGNITKRTEMNKPGLITTMLWNESRFL